MIRLDKFLADSKIGSRSEVKKIIKNGRVRVEDAVVTKPEFRIKEGDRVSIGDRTLCYEPFVYYMLHKPAGLISATEDTRERTVMDLFQNEPYSSLFPVGRLDKDTEGLLLITNDGMLGHRLTSPGFHVPKCYYAQLRNPLTEDAAEQLRKGVDIGEKAATRPAAVTMLSEREAEITITEGKFHQVKRMFAAVDNEVLYLKRISMGNLKLDPGLPKGSFRRLTENEISYLKNLQ